MYVLRDPRDGAVFLVGRGRNSVGPPSVEDIASTDTAIMGRVRAIGDDGHRVERLILADELTSEAEAATVQQAVLSAYEAAQLSPATLVSAAHHSAAPGSFGTQPPDVDAFDDPHVRRFVSDAAVEIDRLTVSLSQAEAALAAAQSAGFLDADHRQRLESMILQQEAEISRLNATLDRVRALVDLSQWAGRAVGPDAGSTVRIDDLSRALD